MKAINKERRIEILAVVATGLLKFVLMDWLELRAVYITAACVFWFVFIYRRQRIFPNILRRWGFQRAYFKPSFLFLLPFALIAIMIILIYGLWFNNGLFNWHIIPVFLLYPVWGIFQQFMIAGLIAGNLRSLSDVHITENQIVLLTSLLFGLVHYPSIPLMFYAFTMEILFLKIYFRWTNLWSLGLFHGWVSGLFIFLVCERDLWAELWHVF